MTDHIRFLPPWWFKALWDGDASCAFVLDDPHAPLRVGDTVLMQDCYGPRQMRGEITHLFSGTDFAKQDMVCVSFGCTTKLLNKETRYNG